MLRRLELRRESIISRLCIALEVQVFERPKRSQNMNVCSNLFSLSFSSLPPSLLSFLSWYLLKSISSLITLSVVSQAESPSCKLHAPSFLWVIVTIVDQLLWLVIPKLLLQLISFFLICSLWNLPQTLVWGTNLHFNTVADWHIIMPLRKLPSNIRFKKKARTELFKIKYHFCDAVSLIFILWADVLVFQSHPCVTGNHYLIISKNFL